MFKRKKDNKKQECLKCQYEKLMKEGKEIFKDWDQKSKPPKRLIIIQRKLIKLRKQIKNQKINDELSFCAEHPEIYEFLPLEWT